MKIAVDLEGGDHSPYPQWQGSMSALQKSPNLELSVFAHISRLQEVQELTRRESQSVRDRLDVLFMDDVVQKGLEDPAFVRQVARNNKTTMYGVASLVEQGGAQAMVTSGNTAGLLAIGTSVLGRVMKGTVPSLALRLPNEHGGLILLDVGANPNTDPMQLVINAYWGAACAKRLCNHANPNVRLLNIGIEQGKGNSTVREAEKMLRSQNHLQFRGFAEPPHILDGELKEDRTEEPIHVVAAGGYEGNLILKMMEAAPNKLLSLVKDHVKQRPWFHPSTWRAIVGGWLLRPTIRSVRDEFKAEVGGGLALGLNHVALKVHGGVDHPHDFEAGILRAQGLAEDASFLQEMSNVNGLSRRNGT